MINKLRFKFEYFRYYARKYFPFFIIGLIFGSSIFVFKNNLIGLVNLPAFHPHIIGISGLYTEKNMPESIKAQISYGLTINNENDRPIISPLVKTMEISDDGKKYTFTINRDIFWHNGVRFSAYDINYNISGVTISPISETKVEVSSINDFAPLLSTLSKHLFLSKFIGLGPYKVVNINYQDGYIKSISLQPIDPKVNPITYHFYQNDTDLTTAYKIGEVDQIETSTFPQQLSQWGNSKVTKKIHTNQKYAAIFFNTKKVDSKQLRQSLAYATPKTADQNERCLGPISANSWAYNPSVKEYNYNPARAKELFENNKIDKITLVVNDRTLLATAENIKNAWTNTLGIKTTVTIENQIDPQNFEVVIAYGGIPHDPDQYLFWHSTQTKTNLTKLNNSRIDKLLEGGRQTTNQQDRKRIYQEFQKYLLEEVPAIFLSYPTTYTVTRIK